MGNTKKTICYRKTLIELGANINHKDSEGTSLIHYAVFSENERIVELLINSGVDLKIKDQYGLTPLVYSLKGKNKIIIDKIKSVGGSY